MHHLRLASVTNISRFLKCINYKHEKCLQPCFTFQLSETSFGGLNFMKTPSTCEERSWNSEIFQKSFQVNHISRVYEELFGLKSLIIRFGLMSGTHFVLSKLKRQISVIVPTFDTKVTEYLCSGWFFFSSDFLTSHFWRNFFISFKRYCCPELKFEKIFHLWSFFVKLWGFKDCHFGQLGTINARYISRY